MNNTSSAPCWPELEQGDPLADAVIEDWFQATPQGHAYLKEGMTNGVKSIPHAPESYRKFLQSTETFLDRAPSLDQAAQAYLLAGPLWISVSLGPGALLHTYTDPAIARTLVGTGKLVNEAAARRLSETQLWFLKLLEPDAWRIGGSGYVHTLQVRLIHAKVRASLLRKTSQNSEDVLPIDLRQMVRTWLDFSIVSPHALEQLGIGWNEEEKTQVAHLWHLVGELLGIPSDLMSKLSLPADALAWLGRFNQEIPTPDGNARLLTLSMLEALGQRMAIAMKLPKDVAISLMHGFARHIHGEALANTMGASDTSLTALIPTYINANRYHMQQIRSDRHYKKAVIDQSIAQIKAICAQIDGSAAYQEN